MPKVPASMMTDGAKGFVKAVKTEMLKKELLKGEALKAQLQLTRIGELLKNQQQRIQQMFAQAPKGNTKELLNQEEDANERVSNAQGLA